VRRFAGLSGSFRSEAQRLRMWRSPQRRSLSWTVLGTRAFAIYCGIALSDLCDGEWRPSVSRRCRTVGRAERRASQRWFSRLSNGYESAKLARSWGRCEGERSTPVLGDARQQFPLIFSRVGRGERPGRLAVSFLSPGSSSTGGVCDRAPPPGRSARRHIASFISASVSTSLARADAIFGG
jgi:hypothetical protein